jgi:hypothetical protein
VSHNPDDLLGINLASEIIIRNITTTTTTIIITTTTHDPRPSSLETPQTHNKSRPTHLPLQPSSI